MKEIVEYFMDQNMVFRSLKQISPKEFGSRKKIDIYLGVDSKGFYTIIIRIEKKSRILQKEARELMEFHQKLERYIDSNITKKNILIKAEICSKSVGLLEESNWKVYILQ